MPRQEVVNSLARVGAPLELPGTQRMKGVLLCMLRGYKRYISPWLPRSCRFEPTCSQYMYQAVDKNGVVVGVFLGLKRLLRCHPFCRGGYDPVP